MNDVLWIKIPIDTFDKDKIKLLETMPERRAVSICGIEKTSANATKDRERYKEWREEQ